MSKTPLKSDLFNNAPVNYLGDGLNKLLTMLLVISELKRKGGGCLLIDEMENGFHYSFMPKFWEVIADAVKKSNVQIIATTHSLEFIGSAYEVNKRDDIFSLYRLERIHNELKVVSYDKEDIDFSIEQNWEMR